MYKQEQAANLTAFLFVITPSFFPPNQSHFLACDPQPWIFTLLLSWRTHGWREIPCAPHVAHNVPRKGLHGYCEMIIVRLGTVWRARYVSLNLLTIMAESLSLNTECVQIGEDIILLYVLMNLPQYQLTLNLNPCGRCHHLRKKKQKLLSLFRWWSLFRNLAESPSSVEAVVKGSNLKCLMRSGQHRVELFNRRWFLLVEQFERNGNDRPRTQLQSSGLHIAYRISQARI
jgi:hypothetical protein